MNSKFYLSLLVIISLFQIVASCNNIEDSLENLHTDEYISFSYPQNWVVSEIDSSNKSVRIYFLEKHDNESNSTVLNLIINLNAKKQFAFYNQTDMINKTYNKVSFSEVSEIEFLNKSTVMSTYSFETINQYIGANFSLQCGNNVLGINYQFSADEQIESFKEILNTLDLRNISN